MKPFLPLVAHLKSNLKYHRNLSCLLKLRETNKKFAQGLGDSQYLFIIDCGESVHFIYAKWYFCQDNRLAYSLGVL